MQVKFRVWDHIKQEWNTLRFFLSPDGELIDRHTGQEQQHRYTAFEGQRRFIPVFWTGLKDKNGQEIYEGDLLCSPSGTSAVVNWDLEGSCWRRGQIAFLALDVSTQEVIGNRWENPELLREET